MPFTIEFGVAKVNKYASRESGDTVEIVERPGGGLTAVLIDGQGSGYGAKALSLMLSAKVVGMVKEGVRDGAVARAAHDILSVAKSGKVSATLEMLSVDSRHRSIVLTRNSDSPAFLVVGGTAQILTPSEGPIGTASFARPEVKRFALEAGIALWVMSDGVVQAGRKFGDAPLDLLGLCAPRTTESTSAPEHAHRLLAAAIAADRARPADDMSVIVLVVSAGASVDTPRGMQVAMTVL
jgi:serine phosphatase RsbU (regulator of sigma subunit)